MAVSYINPRIFLYTHISFLKKILMKFNITFREKKDLIK
jgi:hypothetical protein